MIAKLSVSQRREMWLQALTQIRASGSFFSLYPHDGGADPITILVLGSGGFGDIISLTPILRELRRTFRGCHVYVAHPHPAAEQLLASLPTVAGVASLGSDVIGQLAEIASVIDIFDLVVDVRYAITYTAPPMSRVPFDFMRVANSRAIEWQRYTLVDWPHLNNQFAKEATRRGFGLYDLAGYTGNLAVTQGSTIHLAPAPPKAGVVKALVGKAYATVHHGADPKMAGLNGLQTKNLPTEHWETIVAGLKKAGLLVAQLGEKGEAPIKGVSLDLRGALSFQEAASVIKFASVHVDTEGGLVHAARAMFTRAVVAFGPTSVPFFAYPMNVNLAPAACGDCWWTSQDWSRTCPRGLERPECMDSQKPRNLIDGAVELAADVRVLTLWALAPGGSPAKETGPAGGFAEMAVPFVGAPGSASVATPASALSPRTTPGALAQSGPAPTLAMRARQIALAAGAQARGLILVEDVADLREWADLSGDLDGVELAAPAEIWREADDDLAGAHQIHPIFDAHMAIETDAYDWIAMDLLAPFSSATMDRIIEAGRCVRPGGRLSLRLSVFDDDQELKLLTSKLRLHAGDRLGGRYGIDLAAIAAALPQAPVAADAVEIDLSPMLTPRAIGIVEEAVKPDANADPNLAWRVAATTSQSNSFELTESP